MKRLKILLLCFVLIILPGCRKETESYSKTELLMDTVVTIKIYGGSGQVLEEAFDLCRDYEKLFSRTIEDSEISRINNSGGEPQTVSRDTSELILKGIYYGQLSNGRFDITIYPASSLWDFTSQEKHIPAPEELEEAVKHIDYRKVKVEGGTVTVPEGTKLDLGGIAKGYIADKVAEFLRSKGVGSAIINLGGNVYALGTKPDGSKFSVGIQKPFDKTGNYCALLYVQDKTVVTSGTYQRYIKTEDALYHHILDPATGMPVQNELDSVTIIAERSADADALSTVCFVLGIDEGLELIETIPNTEAVFITKGGELVTTSGLERTEREGNLVLNLK